MSLVKCRQISCGVRTPMHPNPPLSGTECASKNVRKRDLYLVHNSTNGSKALNLGIVRVVSTLTIGQTVQSALSVE